LRLVLPLLALLIIVDISLALLARAEFAATAHHACVSHQDAGLARIAGVAAAGISQDFSPRRPVQFCTWFAGFC